MKSKIIVGFLIVLLLTCFITTFSYADKLDSVIGKMSGVTEEDTTMDEMQKSINMIIGLLQISGTGISVVTVTILGAKYMLSSADQKAEIKQKAMPVVIGMVILFGAVNIVAIVGNLANKTMNQ